MRMRRSIERIVAGGMVLAVLITVIQMTRPEPAAAAELETNGEGEAHPGSTVQVTGDGYLPLLNVRLCWDQPRCNDLGTAEMGVLATSFSHTVTIPEQAPPGPHEIYACQTTCDSAPVEVVVEETAAPTTTTTTSPPSSTGVTQTTTTLASSTTSVTSAPGAPTTTIGATTSTAETTTTSPSGDPDSPTTTGAGTGSDTTAPIVDETDRSEETAEEGQSTVIRYTPPTTTQTSRVSERGILDDSSPAPEAAGSTLESLPRDVTGWAPPPAPLFWAIWLLVVAGAVAVFYAIASRMVTEGEPPDRGTTREPG